MMHEIAGDVIYFDDPKENTTRPHIVELIAVCAVCVGGWDYLRDLNNLSIPPCVIIPAWLCVLDCVVLWGQRRTSAGN